jgi:pimeloyl-ACP methyl ester carboxylesterase
MGGATAAYAAYKYPELIGKALLEDPAWWDDNPHQPMTEEERQTFVEEAAPASSHRRANPARRSWRNAARIAPWAEEELGNWAISKQQMSPYVIGIFEQQRPPWREMVAEIRCPVLLITANVERGAIVTPPMAEEAARIAPHLQVAPIPTAGHNVRREDFPAYMAAVKAFLHNS